MTEKEKAKAYDEAIERTKKIYGNGIIEEIFPELKEEDAERIRKNCIHFLELQKQHHAATFEIEECIDWLEKQGKISPILSNSSNTGKNEQKSDDNVEPKFKVGNWYQCTKSFYGKGVIFTKNTAYYCTQKGCLQDEYGCHIAIVKDLYDNFKLWTIQDAKDGDVLANDHHILILKELVYDWSSSGTPYSVKAYCGIKPNGNFEIGKDNWCFCGTLHIHPATKEQRDALMKAMNDAGYKWNTETKTLGKLIESKFDPKTLKSFDKVLGFFNGVWNCDLYSHYYNDDRMFPYVCFRSCVNRIIPYNDDTKHLVGTTEEAPEFYRYWEE